MKNILAPLTLRQQVAEGTWEARFTISEPDFHFTAGQYMTMTAPGLEQADIWERMHDFSICSAPEELPSLTITFRTSPSKFKTSILSIPEGTPVSLEGPKGYFTLPEDPTQSVSLIAGGIGVTPFMSMVRHSVRSDSMRPITLYYFNRDKASAAYLSELKQYRDQISVHPVFGLFNGDTLAAHNHHRPDCWYIAGPPALVILARNYLTQAGVADVNIRTEGFTGYV